MNIEKYDIPGIDGVIAAIVLFILLGVFLGFTTLMVAAMYGVPIYWTVKLTYKGIMWAVRSPTVGPETE